MVMCCLTGPARAGYIGQLGQWPVEPTAAGHHRSDGRPAGGWKVGVPPLDTSLVIECVGVNGCWRSMNHTWTSFRESFECRSRM